MISRAHWKARNEEQPVIEQEDMMDVDDEEQESNAYVESSYVQVCLIVYMNSNKLNIF